MSTQTAPTESGLINEREAARRLGVCRMTLLRMRAAGEIGHYRIGVKVLYSQKHLDDFLESREHKRVA